jgi:hypothetical protein
LIQVFMENLSFYEDTQHSDGAPALQTVGRLDDRERKDGEEGEDNVDRRVASREIGDCAGHEGKRCLRAGKAGGCKRSIMCANPGDAIEPIRTTPRYSIAQRKRPGRMKGFCFSDEEAASCVPYGTRPQASGLSRMRRNTAIAASSDTSASK